jgi:molybdate transport system permease protein
MADIVFPLRLSFQVALLATLGVAAVGIPLAYLLARRRSHGQRLLEAALMLPMVLPPVVTGYYLLLIIGRNGLLGRLTEMLTGTAVGLNFTWQAAVLASAVVSLPLTIRTARAAIEAIDPGLLRISYSLGRTELETALHVVLPLAWRGIVAGLALSFARALGEFGATVMVAGNIPGKTNTMALEIYNAVMFGDWQVATTLVIVFTVVSSVALIGASRLAEVGAR